MGDSYISSASLGMNLIRMFLSFVLDKPAFGLLSIMYQLFFNVASVDIFASDTVMKFYGRVQLILGVYMMFQLAMSIIKGIVNPDTFFSADKGAGNLIMRIMTALFLLTALVPINIPSPKNEFEKQINNNGLLFGSLYSLQHRILSNNTLGRLILGTNDEDSNYVSDSTTSEDSLKRSANIFTSTVLKGFYRINVKEEGLDPKVNSNRVCQSGVDAKIDYYSQIDADPQKIISMATATCTGDWWKLDLGDKVKAIFSDFWGDNEFYVFAYTGFISAIVAFIFAFILLSFTIDIAVRAVKLGVLRLIAPIPIISYMDPKGSKDGAFNAWVKTLVSTYLDLFMRLAIVYFVIFLVQDMMVNGIVMNHGSGLLGIFSYIIIWIGLFIFAKQAPKFFRKVLGLKEEGGKFFSGIGESMALGAAGLGVIGGAMTNYRAAKEENAELLDKDGNHLRHQGLRNFGSAIAGAIGGGYTGMKAFGGKDATAKSVMQAQNQRNAMRAAHSTLPGRIASSGYNLVMGESLSTRGNKIIKGAQDWVKAQGDWKTALEDEAKKQGVATNLGGGIVARYEELERAVAAAHDGRVTINGTDYDANMFTASYMDDALKAQVRDYQIGGTAHTKAGGTTYEANIAAGGKLYKKREDAIRMHRDVDVSGIDNPNIRRNSNDYNVDRVDTFGKAIGAANNVISNQENDMRQRMRNANDQAKK